MHIGRQDYHSSGGSVDLMSLAADARELRRHTSMWPNPKTRLHCSFTVAGSCCLVITVEGVCRNTRDQAQRVAWIVGDPEVRSAKRRYRKIVRSRPPKTAPCFLMRPDKY